MTYEKFHLVSIDAWREYEGGWIWNECWIIEKDIIFSVDSLTPRKILKALREWGYLTNESKGRLTVDFSCDECIEIQMRGTFEPILALSQLHGN